MFECVDVPSVHVFQGKVTLLRTPTTHPLGLSKGKNGDLMTLNTVTHGVDTDTTEIAPEKFTPLWRIVRTLANIANLTFIILTKIPGETSGSRSDSRARLYQCSHCQLFFYYLLVVLDTALSTPLLLDSSLFLLRDVS